MDIPVDGVTKHVPCPRCRERGSDTRGDNMVVYDDGHKWCFSCRYWEPPTLEERINPKPSEPQPLNFPDDFQPRIPVEAAQWLRRFGITLAEIRSNGIGWSDSRKLLIFPIRDGEGRLIAWQGRNFAVYHTPEEAVKARKYLTFGNIRDIMHVLEPQASAYPDLLVVVEGVIDAIKVARVCPAMPLFGSNMPLGAILRAARRFGRLGVWLDSDKTAEAVKTALRASQYMPAVVIATEEDPKAHMEGGIAMLIEEALKDPQPEITRE